MLETFGVCAVAVLIVGIMMILFLDVIRKNRSILISMSSGAPQAAEKQVQGDELKPVYPSYVDCSRDYMNTYHEADRAAEVNPLVQKQGA